MDGWQVRGMGEKIVQDGKKMARLGTETKEKNQEKKRKKENKDFCFWAIVK